MRIELLKNLPYSLINGNKYYKQIYYHPSYYPVQERISTIEHYTEQGLSLYEIGYLFGVTEAAIKYNWERYYLRTWKPKTKKIIKKKRDVYAEFKAHYDEVMG